MLPPAFGNWRADVWPCGEALPDACCASIDFDTSLYGADDFRFCGWAMPEAIGRSVAKRQAAFLAGRLCADRALRGLTGRGGCPPVGRDRAPVWPPSCVGSISHCQGRALAVVGMARRWDGLGLDIEDRAGADGLEDARDSIVTDAEFARLRAISGADGDAVILGLSLKESLFKALFPLCRRMFYCDAADIEHCSGDGTARLRLRVALAADWPAGRCVDASFAILPAHVYSVVAIPARTWRP